LDALRTGTISANKVWIFHHIYHDVFIYWIWISYVAYRLPKHSEFRRLRFTKLPEEKAFVWQLHLMRLQPHGRPKI
jgi:hypothetical protein